MKEQKKIKSFKGFDKNMKCRDMQYVVGESYKHDGKIKACESGFHACENPIDIFNYYAPADSIFCEVEQSGDLSTHDGDSKVASSEIKVIGKIDIAGMVKAAFDFTFSRCIKTEEKNSTGYRSASSATGDRSASSATGDRSASSATGDQSASSATGDQSASSATGYQSASSATGDRSASSATGYRSASSATGDRSASSATGDQSASSATGDRSASSATGYRSASLTTGYYSTSSIEGDKKESVAIGVGYENKAKASAGNWIVLAHRNNKGEILHIKSAKVGGRIKADTWYQLNAAGKFIKS